MTAPALMTALAEVMQQASRLKGMEALGTFREPAHLECILDTLRMHADEGPASTPENQLRQFLFRRVQPEEGSSVTMKELGEAYGRHCVANDIPLPPQRSLSNLITATIRQTFDLVQSHNVLREGRQVRGYRNLKLTLE